MKLNLPLSITLAVVSGACHQTTPTAATTPSNATTPKPPATKPSNIACELHLEAAGPHFWISFILSNPTDQEKVIHYFRPFMDFKIRATADGHELAQEQSQYDGGVQPTELHLPSRGRATLDTPIKLVFAPRASRSVMTWTIIGVPPVDLVATLQIDGESIQPCSASMPAS